MYTVVVFHPHVSVRPYVA